MGDPMKGRPVRGRPEASSANRGFSLIEVLIAMFVLALMALALIPLLIGATRLSVTNRSLAAASAFATAEIAEVQSAFGNDSPRLCSELSGYKHNNFPDPAGTGLVAVRKALEACGADEYSTITIQVSVAAADKPTHALVTLTTKVLVAKG
ncbi:MAG: prepilin-type N-terminal cleavage/methylation domain-containing protein [Propionicimonas sp.]